MIRATSLIAVAMVALSGPISAQMVDSSIRGRDIDVVINGRPVDFRYGDPVVQNGRLLIPIRSVLSSLPASAIVWDPVHQVVSAAYMNRSTELQIGSRKAVVNGRNIEMDVPAMTIRGRTMVPLRFLSEALGAVVSFSQPDLKVTVSMPMAPIPRGVTPTPTIVVRGSSAPRRFFRSSDRGAQTIAAADTGPVMTDEELLAALERQVQMDWEVWAANRAEWRLAQSNFQIWSSIQTSFNSMMVYNGSSAINGMPPSGIVLLNPGGWASWQITLDAMVQRDLVDQQRLNTDYAAYVAVFRRVNPSGTPLARPIAP
jgi:hypothetical protein